MADLNEEQQFAYDLLGSEENVFLTGAAGSGKSYVLRKYFADTEGMLPARHRTPILASTGAAAILINGRTFHGFFGLGIMKGGPEAVFREAMENDWLVKRMRRTHQVVIDEVSMISGPVLALAERIAREARERDEPWGGMRIIAVGDFAQLPPVNPHSRVREWAFLDPVWEKTGFRSVMLKQVMRTDDPQFIKVLNKIRIGECDGEVTEFLDNRTKDEGRPDVLRLFSHRENTERYNLERLADLPGSVHAFRTEYQGSEWAVQQYGKNLPVPNLLQLKEGALVMFRTNATDGSFANGTLGTVTQIEPNVRNADAIAPGRITVQISGGRIITVFKHAFECLDKEGEVALTALQFPIVLAWASTIHKAQGITCDRIIADVRKLWEPGQAYVALSRVRSAEGLFLAGWNKSAIFADKQVIAFHRSIS